MKNVFVVLTAMLLCLALPSCALAASDAGDSAIPPEIEAMLPAFDSIMRAAGYEDVTYQPRDPQFFWDAVYLMAVNWSGEHPLANLDEDTWELILPRQAVRELASALFADYDDLLPVPEPLSASAIYDDPLDAYRFPMSDAGDSYAEIESVTSGDDGPTVVYACMKSASEEDEVFQRMRFELTPNPYADGIGQPIYLYSVVSAQSEEIP